MDVIHMLMLRYRRSINPSSGPKHGDTKGALSGGLRIELWTWKRSATVVRVIVRQKNDESKKRVCKATAK